MKKVFLHIGYGKTGTTTIQKAFLQKQKDVRIFDKHFIKDIREALHVQRLDDPLIQELRMRSKAYFDETDTGIVLSDEGILGSIGTSDERFASGLQKIAAIFSWCDDMEFILSIRRQEDIIPSLFVQNMGIGNKEKFIEHVVRQPYLYYDRIIEGIKQGFGESKVHVLFFEQLVESAEQYVQEWVQILDVDKSQALKLMENQHKNRKEKTEKGYVVKVNLSMMLYSFLVKILPYKITRINFLKKMYSKMMSWKIFRLPLFREKDISFTGENKRLIREIYHQSNINLSKKYPKAIELAYV